jgi:enoyl-CoA hydratase/carnithine racemase
MDVRWFRARVSGVNAPGTLRSTDPFDTLAVGRGLVAAAGPPRKEYGNHVVDVARCQTELVENGRALVVTLDHPPDNAVTAEMLAGLGAALDRLHAAAGPELLILTGTGQTFSKGFDVRQIHAHASPAAHRAALTAANDVVSRLAATWKPTIAAINGHCLGAGLELALACHFRLCAPKARLGLPELTRGLLPGLGGIDRLVRLLGQAKALELIALGAMIPADEAQRVGLVHRLVPREGFFDGVLSFARALLAVDPVLLAETLRLCAASAVRAQQDCIVAATDAIVRLCTPVRPAPLPGP